MVNYGRSAVNAQLASAVVRINSANELPFKDVLSSDHFSNEFASACLNYRERIFPPQTTLLAFMAQALCPDHSCQQAVLRVNAERAVNGLKLASADTAAYCKARGRLPENLLHKLVCESGQHLERAVPSEWLWNKRHVKLIDGSCVSMPDTKENQLEYPQHSGQKPGLGFPIARIAGVLSLAFGTVLDLAIGPCKGKQTGEHALLRQLLHCFKKGDIALADAYYCSYFLIAALQQIGVDIVSRKHGARNCDFRRGKRLGKGDHLVTYCRPKRKSSVCPAFHS